MAVAGTGFAAGLRSGGGLVSQALENQRLDEAADRQAQEFGWKKTDREKAEADDKVQRDFRARILAASSGIDPATSGQVQTTYGLNPQQQAGEGANLPAKLATYDQPDASELPGGGPGVGSAYGQAIAARNAQAAGGAPATGLPTDSPVAAAAATAKPFTAEDVKVGKVDQVKLHDLIGQAALAKGDYEGYGKAKAAGRAADVQDITDSSVKEFMDMSPEDRAKRAWSPNLTGNVPLLTTKVDKNGMTVLVVNADGSTDGKPMKLSWQDAAQLHAAEAMAGKGYGAEAIDTATKVNARIGEAIKAQNATMKDVATTNTEAAYKGGQLAMEGAKVGIMREELGLKRDKQKMDSTEVLGVTNDGILNRSKTTGAVTIEPFPAGLKDDQKEMIIKKYRSVYEPKIAADGQTMVIGPQTYDRNPNYNNPKADKSKVNTVDQWLETTPNRAHAGSGQAALDDFNARNQGPPKSAAAAAPGAPAAPAAPAGPPAPAFGLQTLGDTPPVPGSKVARMRERSAARATQKELMSRTNLEAAGNEAARVIQSGDKRAAYNLMGFSGFDDLPKETKIALSRLANS